MAKQQYPNGTFDDGDQVWAVFQGAAKRQRKVRVSPQFGQNAELAQEFINQAAMTAIPPAMEAAVAKIEARYDPWPKVVVGALIVTAVATAAIALMMASERV